jgi:hypothetical protein
MELDPKYADVIVQRWQDFTGKAATLEGDGRGFAEIAAGRGQDMTDETRDQTQADPSETDRGQPRQAAA